MTGSAILILTMNNTSKKNDLIDFANLMDNIQNSLQDAKSIEKRINRSEAHLRKIESGIGERVSALTEPLAQHVAQQEDLLRQLNQTLLNEKIQLNEQIDQLNTIIDKQLAQCIQFYQSLQVNYASTTNADEQKSYAAISQLFLKSVRFEEIDPDVGSVFDPDKHQFVLDPEDSNSNETPENQIIKVVQKGLEQNGTVLIKAEVCIGTGKVHP